MKTHKIQVEVNENDCARVVFSFSMARGTETYKISFDEFVETVLEAATSALMAIGHAGNGRLEALITKDGVVNEI